MNVLTYGSRALLVEVADSLEVPAMRAAMAELPGVIEVVPGARTVLVEFDAPVDGATWDRLHAAAGIAEAAGSPGVAVHVRDDEVVRLPVRYDGADLAEVATMTGLTTSDVIARHSAPTYVVAFCGFSPGFAYLTGLDPALVLPRLDEPRLRVPAGAVGVASEFTGVYPRASPGGWRLLGSTDAVMWDVDRDPPALLPPGTRVRFTPT